MADIKSFLNGIKNNKIEQSLKKTEGLAIEKADKIAETAREREAGRGGEAREKVLEEIARSEAVAGAALPVAAGIVRREYEERQKEIEKVLEAGLQDVYLALPADKQREFAASGEATAREINGLLEKAKVKVKKIIELIKKWLSVIPGVNKFFLEQEAKIKADEIVKFKKDL